jgi:hypothetical protein
MPLYECSACHAVDRTSLANFWNRLREKNPALCSECDPEIGKWHGQFEKLTAEDFLKRFPGDVQERTDHPSKALRFAVACHLIQDECDAILPAHRMIAGVIVLASASVAEPIEESNHPIPMGRIPMGPDIAAAGGPYIRPSGSALSTTGSGRRGSRSMPSGG